MRRVSHRLPKNILENLDADVERGRFPNRSEGIRYILTAYYDETEFSEDVGTEPFRSAAREARSDGGRDRR